MIPRILRALVAALLVAGGIVAIPAGAAQAAGVTFSVRYGADPGPGKTIADCYVSIPAIKAGVKIASGTSTAEPPQQPPNIMEAWDFVKGGAPVQLQIADTTGKVTTYAVPDRVGQANGGHFARNIFYPIYRWRIVADNQVSGWVIPATNLHASWPLCY